MENQPIRDLKPVNRKDLAGTHATDKVIFGACSRYAVYAIHTRFDNISWIVEDSEVYDYDNSNKPTIIARADSLSEVAELFGV